MKRLSLEEIMNLPKASVIWCEMHDQDHESNCDFYDVFPMLICVPGRDGVLSWADRDSQIALDIDEKLITEDRFFWDSEPAADQISTGIPLQELNRFFEENDVREIQNKRFLHLITSYGFSVPSFSKASGISQARIKGILKGKAADVSDVWKISQVLNMSIDDLFEYLRKSGSKVITISEYMKGGYIHEKA